MFKMKNKILGIAIFAISLAACNSSSDKTNETKIKDSTQVNTQQKSEVVKEPELINGVISGYLQLKNALVTIGLELITDKKSMLIEKIKNSILELVHYSEEPVTKKYSCFLSEKLKYDYTYLSNLFKKSKGICIEDYIIAHKIERVKQLLVFSNLNLTEISYQMNYSSVGHLSNQFKKVTGVTTGHVKQLKNNKFIPLDVQ